MRNVWIRSFWMASVVVVMCADAALAAEPGWQLRIRGAQVDPDFRFEEVDDVGDRVVVEADSEIGFGLGLEYRVNNRIGVELAALHASPDLDLRVESVDELTVTASDGLGFTPITLGVSVHLTTDAPIDVWVAPQVAYVLYDDVTVSAMGETESLDVDDDFGWGATLGADLGLGDGPWSVNAAITYLDTSIEVADDEGDSESFDFDTMIYSVGVGLRF